MIALPRFEGRTVAVLGLGKSGQATMRSLRVSGARVLAWDDKVAGRALAEREGADLVEFGSAGLLGAELLVLSPGIPRDHPAPHPAVARARAEGVPVASDIDLLAEARPEAEFVGITGTNGKSTTTALIHHILAGSGRRSEVGGNLGPAALGLEPLGKGGVYVLEVSSYQLETISKVAWSIGVFLNITPDHLDRYPSMDAYVAAKERLIQAIRAGGTAVIGVDDDRSRAIAEHARRRGTRVVPISSESPAEGGVWTVDGELVDETTGTARSIVDLGRAQALPGRHNWQNACAATAATLALGLAPEEIAPRLLDFPGLDHRQQVVATVAGIRFVNDSKGTNADAAAKALGSYPKIYWIAGGRPKEGGIEAVDPFLARVRHAFLIGEARRKFAEHLKGRVTLTQCDDLDQATEAAFEAALAAGDTDAVILLSPACASFDQFANFEARGQAFVASATGIANRFAARRAS